MPQLNQAQWPLDGMPPELMNNEPDGFAWGVWHDRTPKLLSRVMAAHPFGPRERGALASLADEIATGVIEPLPGDSPDAATWAAWGARHLGAPWLDAPFLWSESYFYRRLLEATGYVADGPWRGVDPFAFLKDAELADPALDPDLLALDQLAELPAAEQGQAKLLAALWGNRADLGFRIGREAADGDARTAPLVVDDSPAFWTMLQPGASVIVVADNAGRELIADLVLIDHLLEHGQASTVAVHVKPRPYYVSDATGADVAACLRRMSRTAGTAARIAARLRAAFATGQITLAAPGFYCAPWSYHCMPADLAAEFGQASVTVLKGDLNYRRLTGDLHWPPTTPFAEAASYFPGSVAALRTLKSDVITGVEAATVANLDATQPSWRTDGLHGVLQVRGRPEHPAAGGSPRGIA